MYTDIESGILISYRWDKLGVQIKKSSSKIVIFQWELIIFFQVFLLQINYICYYLSFNLDVASIFFVLTPKKSSSWVHNFDHPLYQN